MRFPQAYEVILVLHGFQAKYRDYLMLFRDLERKLDGVTPWSVIVHHRRRTQTAVFTLRYDPRTMNDLTLSRLSQAAIAAGGSVIDVPNVPPTHIGHVEGLLNSCRLFLAEAPSPEAGLVALAAALGIETPPELTPERGDKQVGVRMRRSGQWQPARLCRADTEELYVATSAPPRRGDQIELELSLGDAHAVAVVQVTDVSPPHLAGASRIPGFAARIVAPPSHRGRTLSEIMARAREELGTLKPPLRRRDARFPVRWPVTVAPHGMGRVHSMVALDISQRGLFISGPVDLPLKSILDVILPSDDHPGTPVKAQACVVRHIGGPDAESRGLPCGVGLRLMGLHGERNKQRFDELVERVARRAQKRVVVGAGPGRMEELVASLGGAGYAVYGGSDPSSLLARAEETELPPDLVILDESLAGEDPDLLADIEARFAAERLFTVSLSARESPVEARLLVDDALAERTAYA